MPQVVFNIPTTETEIARQRGDAARLIGQQREKITTERYRVTVTVTFSPVVSAPSSASARRT
jgi:hypothetical protein